MAEVRRLMRHLLTPLPSWEEVVHWSRWRRRHQAIARVCHYRKRGAIVP